MKKLLPLLLLLIFTVSANDDDFGDDELAGFEFTGFLEFEQGGSLNKSGPIQKDNIKDGNDWIMANRRFRLMTSKDGSFFSKIDFIRDDYTNETYIDIRELRLQYKLSNWLDLSVGKQVSTWGVADMLFINDLFPKNWKANFLGRDMEAMKDSSTSIRTTAYIGETIFDLVYTPKFSPDTTPTGCQLSVFDPNSSSLISNASSCGNDNADNLSDHETNSYRSGEIAGQIKRKFGMQEIALYGYHGYYKNPKGLKVDTVSAMLVPHYPRLSAVGASSEGQVGPGIFTAEVGFYYSHEDDAGNNPLIENSMLKYLLGYKVDITPKLSIGVQFYQERMSHYDEYSTSMGFSPTRKKESQETYTIRVTYKAQQETLWLNLFTYIRPDDNDGLIKLDVTKRLTNNFSLSAGANIFYGKNGYLDREFGMLKNDDNFFFRLKYDM